MMTLNLGKDMCVEFYESFGPARDRLMFIMLILQMLHVVGWSLNARNIIQSMGKGLYHQIAVCVILWIFSSCALPEVYKRTVVCVYEKDIMINTNIELFVAIEQQLMITTYIPILGNLYTLILGDCAKYHMRSLRIFTWITEYPYQHARQCRDHQTQGASSDMEDCHINVLVLMHCARLTYSFDLIDWEYTIHVLCVWIYWQRSHCTSLDLRICSPAADAKVVYCLWQPGHSLRYTCTVKSRLYAEAFTAYQIFQTDL